MTFDIFKLTPLQIQQLQEIEGIEFSEDFFERIQSDEVYVSKLFIRFSISFSQNNSKEYTKITSLEKFLNNIKKAAQILNLDYTETSFEESYSSDSIYTTTKYAYLVNHKLVNNIIQIESID